MGKRYVPKTYNNRRLFRLIVQTVTGVALAAVVLFLLLFFGLKRYEHNGKLDIPWLTDEQRPSEG